MKVQYCKGIGPKLGQRLEKLGLKTLFDILLHLPIRYEDRTTLCPLAHLKIDTVCAVLGYIRSVKVQALGKKKRLILCLEDSAHHHSNKEEQLYIQWMHFSVHQKQQFESLRPGARLWAYGLVKKNNLNQWIMMHPDYKIIDEGLEELEKPSVYTAVYPTVEGLPQRIFQKLIQEAFVWLEKQPEPLSERHRRAFELITFKEAVQSFHLKPLTESAEIIPRHHPAFVRFIVEEYMVQAIAMETKQRTLMPGWPLCAPKTLQDQFLAGLPYTLTQAQTRVIQEIFDDVNKTTAMMRLLQGDVGSGKTVVAAMALLTAVGSGVQAALMVPTELLAQQHVQKLRQWFNPLNIAVYAFTGKKSIAEKEEILKILSTGTPCIVVGTHALFQEKVYFKSLRLVIIDEQHRFGVEQRIALSKKGLENECAPHQLVMTATPIPRTLAMALEHQLAVSMLDELPPGRKPIQTLVLEQTKRESLIARIRIFLASGSQVYWVCPLIGESEQIQAQAAENMAEYVQKQIPDKRIGLIHGRLTSEAKDAVMQDFISGDIPILVATTVIEVGVDVPNACVMIIENAERMGLAQLHQLRGRVGRGMQESYCILLFQGPLSANAKMRLNIMRESQDGFFIAEKDLELRGPGEFLGTRQSGVWNLRIADFSKDRECLTKANASLSELSTQTKQQLLTRWLAEKIIEE